MARSNVKMVYDAKTKRLVNPDNVKAQMAKRLGEIAQREDNWDDRGSKKVSGKTLANAVAVFGGFVDAISADGELEADNPKRKV